VGSSIDKALEEQILNGYHYPAPSGESIPIAALTLSRFQDNNNQTYIFTQTHFKATKKDYTTYHCNGKELGKGRYVLEVVKTYVEEHPNITYAKLEAVFPKKLQGSRPVFVSKEDAIEEYETKGHRRHFIKPDEIIKLADSEIAVSTQWGKGNIDNVVEKCNDLKSISKSFF